MRAARAACLFFSLFDQSNLLFEALLLLFPSSMLKLSIIDDSEKLFENVTSRLCNHYWIIPSHLVFKMFANLSRNLHGMDDLGMEIRN